MQSRIRGSEIRRGTVVLLALSMLMSQAAPVLCQGDVTDNAKAGSSFKIDDQPVGSGGSSPGTAGGARGGTDVSSGSGASSGSSSDGGASGGGASGAEKPAAPSSSGGAAGSGGSTGSFKTEPKSASTTPNTDDKNAAETLWLINNQVEKNSKRN